MSESEDVDMTGAALGGPPVGVTPGGQSSDVGQQVEGQIAAPKAPPKALVTKEMLASVRPKSPPNPPRSPRGFLHLRSRRPKLGIDGHRIFERLERRLRRRTRVAPPRSTISFPIGKGLIFLRIPSTMVGIRPRPRC